MQRVLAAIDAEPGAEPVLEVARSIAELFDADVEALHVREGDAPAPRDLARRAGVRLQVSAGIPAEVIIDAARDPDVAAIVLGARRATTGRRPVARKALEVITQVSKPVVVVPPNIVHQARIGRMLVPLEGTSESSAAIESTIALAARRGIDVVVMHVHAPDAVPPFQDQSHHEGPAWKREFLARFMSAPHARVAVIESVGAASEHIAAESRGSDADLLALSWSQDLAPGHADVVREALMTSTMPVLLVPAISAAPRGDRDLAERA